MRISQAIIEIEERLRHDESLKRILNLLEKNLRENAKRKYFITIAPHNLYLSFLTLSLWTSTR